MNLLAKSVVSVAVLVVGLAVVGYFLPLEYAVEREIVIKGKPEQVHSYVADLNQWDAWSPWKAGDDTMVITVGEKATGVGASQSWQGRDGTGELIFTKVEENKRVDYDLTFDGAMKSSAFVSYAADGEGTKVTWRMNGTMPDSVIGGYFAMMMDSMVGGYFEDGLSRLKSAVEGA